MLIGEVCVKMFSAFVSISLPVFRRPSIRLLDTFLFLCFPGVGLRRLGRGLLADMAFSVRDVDIGVDGSEMCNFRYWGEGLDFGGGASDLSEMSRLE